MKSLVAICFDLVQFFVDFMAAGFLFLRSSSLLLSVRSVGQVSCSYVLCRDRVTERGQGSMSSGAKWSVQAKILGEKY